MLYKQQSVRNSTQHILCNMKSVFVLLCSYVFRSIFWLCYNGCAPCTSFPFAQCFHFMSQMKYGILIIAHPHTRCCTCSSPQSARRKITGFYGRGGACCVKCEKSSAFMHRNPNFQRFDEEFQRRRRRLWKVTLSHGRIKIICVLTWHLRSEIRSLERRFFRTVSFLHRCTV